jgi:hypothetical protein
MARQLNWLLLLPHHSQHSYRRIKSVGGHPDLPADGHEEAPMAITERDRIC